MAITLYYAPRTRAVRPRWLLEELGVPYQLKRLDLSKGEHKTADYLKVHPHGVVPALVDDDVTMFESGAICMYLADKFADKKLAPPSASKARAPYYQWMTYAVATLEPPILQIFLHTQRLPEPERNPKLVEQARKSFEEATRVVDARLAHQQYILGAEFSAVDIMVGGIFGWA